ncbi:UNVERIFIED_CONTAM: hypothetical protein Scaly_1835100 [Sesamum calycinum]|uniref:DUF4283 domain-containing protein n=1 Tax=Sesamum calycinum TaxID=2727403 RepID=A0AAW2NFP3_9LAMI
MVEWAALGYKFLRMKGVGACGLCPLGCCSTLGGLLLLVGPQIGPKRLILGSASWWAGAANCTLGWALRTGFGCGLRWATAKWVVGYAGLKTDWLADWAALLLGLGWAAGCHAGLGKLGCTTEWALTWAVRWARRWARVGQNCKNGCCTSMGCTFGPTQNISPQSISNLVHCSDWARLRRLFAICRRFAAVRTNDGRGPPPLDSPLHCELNETLPTNFHQLLEDIRNFKVAAVAGVAPLFSQPSGGRSPSDNHRCASLIVANKTIRLDSVNGASPVMVSFTLNPDDFPPLATSNPSESTHTNSAYTTSFQQGKNAVNDQSANRTEKHSNVSKFFLANSNPPPIGTTHDIHGRPTVIFSDSETQSLVAHFRLALIGKFSQGTPPYSQLHRLLAKSGIKGAFTVSLINNKHALISLSNESDFTRLWLRRIWYLNGFPMRVFKWSPTFTPEQESSIIPIWVNFPELPAHLYRKDALFAIANNIGTPLQIADSTLNQSNLAKARVCVEMDLLKPLLKEIDLQIRGATIVQKIVYEHIPHYCSLCKHVGHIDAECYSKGSAPKPPPHRRNFGQKAAESHKLKGKAVAQDAVKLFDKMPEKMEVGECSKTAEERHRYASADLRNDELDNSFKATENEIVISPNYAVNIDNESCRKDGENVGVGIINAENDVVIVVETENDVDTRIEKKDLHVVVVETENDVSVDAETEHELHVAHEKEADNLILDSTVNVETGGREVENEVVVHANPISSLAGNNISSAENENAFGMLLVMLQMRLLLLVIKEMRMECMLLMMLVLTLG